MTSIVVIPARMASTRFRNKILHKIAGKEMILHCVERAQEAAIGPVLVAVSEQRVFDILAENNINAVLTDPDCPSGSDRVWQALEKIDPSGHYDIVINMQGDLPALDPSILARCEQALIHNPQVDIATPVAIITDESERDNPNVVKVVTDLTMDKRQSQAFYFTRATAPTGDGALFHHIGLYAWRRCALSRFVALEPSALERRERLEQLRAIEAGMRIDAVLVDTVPHGVDHIDDVEKIERMLRG